MMIVAHLITAIVFITECSLKSTPLLPELCQLGIDYLWYNIGIQLCLPFNTLKVIECDHPKDTMRCSSQMFDTWLSSDKEATYAKLLKALVAIGKRSVAVDICQKKCEF